MAVSYLQPMAANSLLLKALEDGDEVAYNRLMRRVFKPSFKAVDEDGNTALHWAVVGDVPSMLRQVMAKGIPYNARNNQGDTPVHWAAQLNRTRGCRYLLALPHHDANVLGRVGGTPLHRAAEAGHEHVVKELLELRADANVADMLGQLPLHKACIKGYDGMVTLLIPHTSSVSSKDLQGDTPAHIAARRGFGAIVGMLQEAGADLNVRNTQNESVLETKPSPPDYAWLIKANANRDGDKATPAAVLFQGDLSLETLV